MVVRFSPDGASSSPRRGGLVKVFDSLTDTTPSIYADLRTNVHNYWDRGLLGMALDPQFPADPNLYVLYTHDAAIGGTAPLGDGGRDRARTRRAATSTGASSRGASRA